MLKLLVRRHVFSKASKPSVRWMTRFAFAGFIVAMFSWSTVHSVMSGLQGDRIASLYEEHPHVLWESAPRLLDEDQKTKFDAVSKKFDVLRSEYILQSEGLAELVRPKEKGRSQGSGIVMRADESLKPGEVVAGAELAHMLSVEPGDRLRLRSVWNLEGLPIDVVISSLSFPKSFEIAKQVLYVSRADLEGLIEQKNVVSRIEFYLKDPQNAEAFMAELKRNFSGPWKTWKDLNRSLLVSLALEKNMMALAMFFLVILASLALYLSLSVRVVERTRQSALLLALGAKMKDVKKIFLIEGFLIGAFGTLLGVLFSGLFCWYLKNIFQLPEMYYSRSIPVNFQLSSVLVLSLLSMGMAFVASYFPSKQVGKIEIAEALK